MYTSLDFISIAVPGYSGSFQVFGSDSMKTSSIYHALSTSY